ncbi:MAG TPA: rRNA methyltransferase [Firmicutes bacterium]|nr:rRNA methyltransferase [Bacillota bacterium]
MTVKLPPALQKALEEELRTVAHKSLAGAAEALSRRYRSASSAPAGKMGPLLTSGDEVTAYAAARLPATFAAIHGALQQVKEVLPSLQPATLVDAGAGPGTVMWAATTLWPGITRITLLERDINMIALGQRLAEAGDASLKEAAWLKLDLSQPGWEMEVSPAELVTASYVLGELPDGQREAFIARLWDLTQQVLVVIEPGTPTGFGNVRRARELLLKSGAHIIAPCPGEHAGPCPMVGDDWCHFSRRVERSRLHRQLKAGDLSYEDEKYSYIAASRGAAEVVVPGRIIRHPQIRKGHIYLQTCKGNELVGTVVTRADRELYKKGRDARWGAIWPPQPQ